MQMRWVRLAVVLSLAPLAGDGGEPSPDAPVPVGVRWAPGQVLRYKLTREVRVLHPLVAGSPADAPKPRETETWTFDLAPRETTAAGTTVDLTLRTLRFQDEWPGRAPTLYDSTNSATARPDDPLHPFTVRSLLIGVPLSAVFGPDGRLLELGGAERIGDHITTALGVSALQDPGLRQSFREEFADGGDIKLTLQRAFALLAGRPAGPGGEWTAFIEEKHLGSGRARIAHRFRLEAIDAAAQARVSARIEAVRDAAGQIPWDREGQDEADEHERALDAYEGRAQAVFDLDLGHVRRYDATVHAAWTNRPDKAVPYERVEEEVELRHTLELLEASGPRAPRPVFSPTPAPPALPAFGPFREALAERCWVSTRTDTTVEMKGAEAEKARCMRQTFVQELDRVLVPLKARDAGRFAALMREQAAWNRLVGVSCPFFDEIQFADLDAGVWGFGTMYGLQERACEQSTAAERAYYAAALRTEQAPLLATHVRAAADGARVTREELGTLRRALAKWLARTGPPPDSGRPVTAEDARRLLDAVAAIETSARELAKSSCANWPALASALGGSDGCAPAMESYYLQHR